MSKGNENNVILLIHRHFVVGEFFYKLLFIN